MAFDSSDLTKLEIVAVDYIYNYLMDNYNCNFTIKKRMYNSNTILFVIHDESVFFNDTFQNWAYKELFEVHLPKFKIKNVAFTFEKQ